MRKILSWILTFAMILSAAGACAESGETLFEQMAGLDWSFSSGVGGWSTELTIQADGSFTGNYHDSEMGETGEGYPDGTLYGCTFSGKMALAQSVDATTKKIRIEKLSMDEGQVPEAIEDGVRYVTAEPYGVREGDIMTLYLPGTPVSKLTEDMIFWAHLMEQEEAAIELQDWLLYSEACESGFLGSAPEMVSMINPWTDMSEAELEQASGLPVRVPEGGEDVICRWLAAESMAEVLFTMDGDDYCFRVKPDALQAGELDNISGMYLPWEHEEAGQIGHCTGTIGLAQCGSEDWAELCLWYDAAPGLMYSLSVYTTDPDGLDLTAVAENIFTAVQGNV